MNSAPASTTKNLNPSYASMRVHCSTGIGHRRRVLERRETGELLRRRHCAAHPRYLAAARLERVLSKRIEGLMHLSLCVRGASQPAYLEKQVAAGVVLRDRGASEPAGFCDTSQGAGWRSSSGVGGFCDTSQHAVAPVSGSRRPGCPDMRCLSGSAEVLFFWFCDAQKKEKTTTTTMTTPTTTIVCS